MEEGETTWLTEHSSWNGFTVKGPELTRLHFSVMRITLQEFFFPTSPKDSYGYQSLTEVVTWLVELTIQRKGLQNVFPFIVMSEGFLLIQLTFSDALGSKSEAQHGQEVRGRKPQIVFSKAR